LIKVKAILLFLLTAALLSGCNIVKNLEPNQKLLVKNTIKAPGLTAQQKDELEALIKQKPNTKILGMRMYCWFYINGNKGKQSVWIRRFFRRVGEAPVILDSGFVVSTQKQMKQYMFNKGYYAAEVAAEISKGRKARVHYSINTGSPYKIAVLYYNIPDSDLANVIYADTSKRVLEMGQHYDLNNLLKEKNRINDILRNNGYFYFTKDYITFDVDSNYRNNTVKLSLNVRNPGNKKHLKFYLRFVKAELSDEEEINPKLDTVEYRGVTYVYKGYFVKPEIMERMIDIKANEIYNQAKVQASYSRLLDMQLFRFVNIAFETVGSDTSGWINCILRMSPHLVNEFVEEPQLITSDQNSALTNRNFRNYGVANNFIFRNKNTFRRGEILQLTWRAALEIQPTNTNGGRYFSSEQSITASLIQPRLLGLRALEIRKNASRNKTSFNLAFTYETNIDFVRRLLTGSYNYQQRRNLFTYSFTPLEVSFIQTNPTPRFSSYLDTLQDIFLRNLFSNNMIMNNRFTVVYSNQQKYSGRSYWYIISDVAEFAGNAIHAVQKLTGESIDTTLGSYRFLGLNYYQYFRSTLDVRYNTIFNENTSMVCRTYFGLGVPYGNSRVMPFERRFFMGGANDLRAWRPRILGPGGFANSNGTQIDRSGEIKLEANIEYRFDILDPYLEGAFFTDAGNIWLSRKDPSFPDGEFNFSRFTQEYAMDAGIGLRLNFSFFIFRLDGAIPLRDPGYAANKRWVINNIGTNRWVRDNLQLNLAIGYPF
jgi:hypothetical protein